MKREPSGYAVQPYSRPVPPHPPPNSFLAPNPAKYTIHTTTTTPRPLHKSSMVFKQLPAKKPYSYRVEQPIPPPPNTQADMLKPDWKSNFMKLL